MAVEIVPKEPETIEAGARRFTYVYEATTAAPGSYESENWITWGTTPREERRFNAVDFRNEIEFGVTEHFQIGLYVADWGYREDPGANEHGFRYQTSALEAIYNLTNPTTDLLRGKRILVTGVLTPKSIAFAIAHACHVQGAEVVLTSFGRAMSLTRRSAQRLEPVPEVLELDVTDTDQAQAIADQLETGA